MKEPVFLMILVIVSTQKSEQTNVYCLVNPSDCPPLFDQQGQCDVDNDCPAGYKCTYQCSHGQGDVSPTTPPPKLPSVPVSACPLDMVIWFDGVEVYKGEKPLEATLGLIYRMLNKFPVSDKGNHVSLGVMSENPRVLLHFNGLGSKSQTNNRIREVLRRVKVIRNWEFNRIDKALDMTTEMYKVKNGARQYARKVLIVITDGRMPSKHYDFPPLVTKSYALQAQGVEIMSAGISLDIDLSSLVFIASSDDYVFPSVTPKFLSKLKGIDKKPCPTPSSVSK